MLPNSDRYWLVNARVPVPLLVNEFAGDREFAAVDLEIRDGRIAQIVPAGTSNVGEVPAIDLKRGLVWCCFVDMHTHLDKGHIWKRAPNLSGTFDEALTTVQSDQEKNWKAEDVYRRMEFGLKCSYAHGTKAIRTHIDSFGEQAAISLEVFKALQAEWADRITLQAVSLVSLDYFLTSEGEKLADRIADVGGVLGGLPLMNEALDQQLDRVFALAKERQLNLDFHTDESGNPDAITLRHVASATLRHEFPGQVVCGHCCSLAVQSLVEGWKTIDLLKQARIGIVSLPMCNLYLQDRNQQASRGWGDAEMGRHGEEKPATPDTRYPTPNTQHPTPDTQSRTPRWRGVTLVHELKQAGVPVAFASDNCRDPFFGFGDHDGLEVFMQAVRIAQLDAPYSSWCRSVTQTPADLMGLPIAGRIGVGFPADLVLFKARNYSELLSRPQSDRIVIRNGKAIDTTLPDYAELDDLLPD